MRLDDDLPEDHEALLRLATEVEFSVTMRHHRETALPAQRVITIPDEAASVVEGPLVDGPLVGIATHGR
jgi:hypothetical protein